MNPPILNLDLTKQAPHSPRERIAGFAIASRTVDKCRASIAGKLGEYHYDCPLDNMLFSFKGINGSQFKYGSFLNALIAFLSIAAAVFFFVVQPVNALMARRRTEHDVDSETAPCPECLSDIPQLARKCAFCSSDVQRAQAV